MRKQLSKLTSAILIGVALTVVTAPAGAQDKVTMALPAKVISFAPLFHALDSGAFKRRSIDLNVVVVTGGTTAIAALLGGDAQFLSVADDELIKIANSNRVIRLYSFTNSFTQNLQVRNEFLKARDITPELPVNERVRRMKGMTMGVLLLGGTSDVAGRWLFHQAGLDPSKDMVNLRIGGLPALLAALKAGKIDGFVISPPAGQIVESLGVGKMAVRYDEVPQWANEPFLGVDIRRDWLEKNRDIARRFVEAVAESQKALYDDPAAGARVLRQGSFNNVEAKLLEDALVQLRHAFRSERMTQAQWDSIKGMRTQLGMKELADVEMKEGVHWSNEFFPR